MMHYSLWGEVGGEGAHGRQEEMESLGQRQDELLKKAGEPWVQEKEGSPVSEGGPRAMERRESSKLSEKPDMGKTRARSRNLNNIHNLMCLFLTL